MFPRLIAKFDQVAHQGIVHQPEVGKVAALALMALEGIPKKVIEQLVSHLVTRGTHPRIDQLGQLYLYSFLLLSLGFLLFFKFRREAFLDTGHNFPINFLELTRFVYLFTLTKDPDLALSKFFFKDELISQKQLTSNYDID
jgi:hypothetical protein